MVGILSLALASLGCLKVAQAVTLTVSTTGGNSSSSLLYGIMFEDINNSGDGGIHGQLLSNNGLGNGTLTGYVAVGDATLSIDTSNPLTSAITNVLKVSVASGTTGSVGFANQGYNGVPVDAGDFSSYFWIKGAYSGSIDVSLYDTSDGTVWGSTTVDVTSTASTWIEVSANLTASQSVDASNAWSVEFDASQVAGGELYFALVRLYPETYYDRYNGLRNDVASFLAEMTPSFLRFPGGNNLEGASVDDRWKWNETVGPVEDRPGRWGDWGYYNSDALGLMEYMQWCIDMGLEPVLAVWAGLSLNGASIITGSALTPYIDDILNELEFLLGSTSTTYGALRASYGRSEPYSLNMIEVGNEDNLSSGCSSYASRFQDIYDAVHAAYPDITIIASTSDSSCLPSPLPDGVVTDIHFYESPSTFVGMFNYFDNWSRDNGIFVGEYAATSNDDGSAIYWTYMQSSCSEAVFMIGLERNSDLVQMASYAPLLEHFDLAEWSPDLFGLSSVPGSITGSTSFYVQKVFSVYRGSTVLPVTSDSAFGPVYWVASSTDDGTYYVKLANYGTSSESVTVKIPSASLSSTATVHFVTGDADTSNYPLDVSITDTSSSVTGSASGGYTFTIPAYGVAVFAVS